MFDIHKTVMLLIDVQGNLAQIMYEKEKLFNALEIMIRGMKVLGVPIIWMEQIPEKLGPTIEPIARHMSGTGPIEKSSFSCCREPAFIDQFEKTGRSQVLLTGIETHICVFQTGYELLKKGCKVQVVTDCVSSRTRENKDLGVQRVVQAGAKSTSVEMIFFELMKKAEGDAFRQIVRLIR